MTWEQICDDPLLRDLPFKIEQDRFGRIVMSPPPIPAHGGYQAQICYFLRTLLPGWMAIAECATETADGVKVPDVAALPRERWPSSRDRACLPQAAEICVEVLSASNSFQEMDEKRRLYADQGCREFWTCSEKGEMAFLEAGNGRKLDRSLICPEFPTLIGFED